MKNKKTIFLILIISITIAIIKIFSNTDDISSDQTTSNNEHKPTIKLLKKTYIKPSIIVPKIKKESLIQSENSKNNLEGCITNKYGIRDDIMEYIRSNPKINTKMAKKAVVKIAQYENKIYYHSKNPKEAMKWSRKEALALCCLDRALPEEWVNISDSISNLMQNTQLRKQHILNIDEKYFSWKILGTGLNDSQEIERCDSGNY